MSKVTEWIDSRIKAYEMTDNIHTDPYRAFVALKFLDSEIQAMKEVPDKSKAFYNSELEATLEIE